MMLCSAEDLKIYVPLASLSNNIVCHTLCVKNTTRISGILSLKTKINMVHFLHQGSRLSVPYRFLPTPCPVPPFVLSLDIK
jgi:hypothetical protein